MSNNNSIYISSNKYKSSSQIINEYKRKYNYKEKYNNNFSSQIFDKAQIKSINPNYESEINNKSTKINYKNLKTFVTRNNIKYINDIQIKEKRRRIKKNKIYCLRELNENKLYNIENEKEFFNNPIPEPLPIKINRNNTFNYNEIIQKIYSNTYSKKKLNKNNKDEFYKKNKLNTIDIIDNCKKSNIYCNNNLNLNIFSNKNINEKNKSDFIKSYTYINDSINNNEKNSNISKREIYGYKDKIKNINSFKYKYASHSLKDNKEINEEYFKEKIKNEIMNNNYNNKLKSSISDNNIIKKYNSNNQSKNKREKNNNKYLSYWRKTTNIKIFKNYYNKMLLKENKNQINTNKSKKSKNNNSNKNKKLTNERNFEKYNLFNKHNSDISIKINNNDFLNKNNNIEEEKNYNIQLNNIDGFLTFKGAKGDTEENINDSLFFENKEINSNKKINKKNIYKSNSNITQNNSNNFPVEKFNKFQENIHNKKNDEKNFENNFNTINNQVEIFEKHLRKIRQKSNETKKKIDFLLDKKRNHTFLNDIKKKFKEISFMHIDKKVNYGNSKTVRNNKINEYNNINKSNNNVSTNKPKIMNDYYWKNKN